MLLAVGSLFRRLQSSIRDNCTVPKVLQKRALHINWRRKRGTHNSSKPNGVLKPRSAGWSEMCKSVI